MLIYERFVFIHMPKTAGTFLRDALPRELGPPEEELTGHRGWAEIPPRAAGRPVLTYVRNPWDWYVSWYHFHPGWMARQPPEWHEANPVAGVLFGGMPEIRDGRLHGVPDFATAVRNACEGFTADNPPVAELLAAGHRHARPMASGDDFYTAQFKYLAGAGIDSEQLTVGRAESLGEDLERFLAKQGVPFESGLACRLSGSAPLNAGDRGPYRDYYDDELRDLVGRSCRMLVARYGYRF